MTSRFDGLAAGSSGRDDVVRDKTGVADGGFGTDCLGVFEARVFSNSWRSFEEAAFSGESRAGLYDTATSDGKRDRERSSRCPVARFRTTAATALGGLLSVLLSLDGKKTGKRRDVALLLLLGEGLRFAMTAHFLPRMRMTEIVPFLLLLFEIW